MSQHFKRICVCGTMITQCRCSNPNKTEEIVSPCKHQKQTAVEAKSPDDTYLVSSNFDQNINDVIGKFTVAPTPYAKTMWDIVSKSPDAFSFEFAYDENDGKKELVEISLVMHPKIERKW